MPKASANNIRIEYETFGDPSSPPILLVIGLGSQLIYWDEAFCRQLAEAGLYVIRFDNRDAGLSTKFDQAGVPDVMDVIGKLMSRQKVTPPPQEREPFIQFNLHVFRALTGPRFGFDEEWVRQIMGRAYDRSFCPQGAARQLVAILTQANRQPALKGVRVPTLIIHGDADPLVSVEGGKDAAEAVPGAELKIIKGMGHDLPHGEVWAQIAKDIIAHTKKACG